MIRIVCIGSTPIIGAVLIRSEPKFIPRTDSAKTNPSQKAKPDGIYRIIMMGGSALYGIGSTPSYPFHRSLMNNETIDFYLEGFLNLELKRAGRRERVEIINAAVTAYWTFQHLIYLNETLFQYDPDLVVFLDGHNDYYAFQPGLNPWLDYPYSSIHLVDSFNNRDLLFMMYTAVRPLSRFSYAMTMLEKGFQRLWEQHEALPTAGSTDNHLTLNAEFDSQYERIAHDSFLRAYTQIKALGDYYGFKLAFFLQPEIIFEAPSVLSPQDVQLQSLTETMRNQINPSATAIARHIRTLLPRLFSIHNFNEFHDVAEIGATELRATQLYIDYCHLTPAGSKTVAEHLSPPILRIILEAVQHPDVTKRPAAY